LNNCFFIVGKNKLFVVLKVPANWPALFVDFQIRIFISNIEIFHKIPFSSNQNILIFFIQ